jgi:hypothetical protein
MALRCTSAMGLGRRALLAPRSNASRRGRVSRLSYDNNAKRHVADFFLRSLFFLHTECAGKPRLSSTISCFSLPTAKYSINMLFPGTLSLDGGLLTRVACWRCVVPRPANCSSLPLVAAISFTSISCSLRDRDTACKILDSFCKRM